MNILYINHYAGSIEHGMEFRPYYLSREWVRQGHKVTIIASNYSHIRVKNINISDKKYSYQIIDGINYLWCKTFPYKENGVKRVINIFSFLYRVKKLIPYFLQKKPSFIDGYIFTKPDVVIASSTYPLDTKVAHKIAKKSGARFIYEVHDLWPLTPIELAGMSKYHPFIHLMQVAENFGYKTANRVVSLLPNAKSYMKEHGMKEDKFVYISNGISLSDYTDEKKELIPTEHLEQISCIKQRFSFLIGYAGGIGESNAIEYLLSAAKIINQLNAKLQEKIAFVLVGDGACKEDLLQRVKSENIENVFFLPAVRKAQVSHFLNQMDALYIGWHKLSIYRFGICPNKLFDYMMAGKPIVHSVTASNDLVAEANCGITVPAANIEAIVQAITEIAKKPKDELEQLGKNGSAYVIKNHDYASLAKHFLENL